ncbi:DJ-1 family protein [Clostridia bacterium]|nr:DJ-1 family protein [Clostridia bacterium]
MIYVFLAEGFEEIEAIVPIDILRRAGENVVTIGIGGKYITGSHNITVSADLSESETAFEPPLKMIVLPGGPGVHKLAGSSFVAEAIDYAVANNLIIAAICAAPSILADRGLLSGKTATCYPEKTWTDKLISGGANVVPDDTVQDGNIITGKAAGSAVQFGLKLVEAVLGSDTAEKIRKSICSDV